MASRWMEKVRTGVGEGVVWKGQRLLAPHCQGVLFLCLCSLCVVSGSYFARDAAYSHHYSKSDSSSHTMFLARVLVGDFTRGSAAFVRPPAKEGQSNAFYDSCVNSMSDPTIFVVFEKHQVYPEYLIQYSTSSKPLASPSIFVTLGSLFTSRQ